MNEILLRLAKLKFQVVELKARRYAYRVFDYELEQTVAQFVDKVSADAHRDKLIENFVKSNVLAEVA